jgi:predicted 3-demethylubiquinone-9 3-methyltransferase (glyoxalase superfamily)
VSWQVIPSGLIDMIGDPDPEKAKRATEAMLSMTKFDIAALEKAYAGE